MKSIIIIAAITAVLVGCAKQTPVTNTASSAVPTVATGYSSENGFVTLLNGESPVHVLPPPNDVDRKYANQVPEPIRNAAIAFTAQPKTEFTIFAARPYGKFLLLDIEPKGLDDGNIHILYDLKREAVVGRFVWYTQG